MDWLRILFADGDITEFGLLLAGIAVMVAILCSIGGLI